MSTPEESLSRRRNDGEAGYGIRILAVDDDRAYLRYVKHVLTRANFIVELADDGASAIERMRCEPRIDILLIDLAMPGLDGIETVRRIQNEASSWGLYTILLTASSGTTTKLRALENGLDDFISKTSAEVEIIAKIRSAARRVEMERRLYHANRELEVLALTDELTGIANRRVLFRTGEEILRQGRIFSLVLFDLDRFKAVNDTYGHLAGDRILADVAASFKANTRYGDIIGRYGGDEFYLVLPDTNLEEARQMAERLAANIRMLRWTLNDTVLTMNAQYGVATSPGSGSTVAELLAVCDQALYRGKRRTAPRPGSEDRPAVR